MKNKYLFLLLFFAHSVSAAGPALTYHGRLLKANGTPVTSNHVQFKIQIRSPGAENCLMYEETLSKDLSSTDGVFSIAVNDGTGSRTDGGSYSISQIFSNRAAFNFSPSLCVSGASSYSPAATDGRSLAVYFNDGTFTGWEAIPQQAINLVPQSIDALQVAGYPATSLLRVENGAGPQSASAFTPANFTELLALINGTSSKYLPSSSSAGTQIPVVGTPPTSPSAGQMWYDPSSHSMKYYNGTTTVDLAAGGSGITSVSGTTNRVNVTSSGSSVTLSTPQDIHSGANPTFAGMTLTALNTPGFVKNNTSGVLSGGHSVSLTTDVSGTLPVTQGGTGATSFANYSAIGSNGSGTLTAVPGSLAGSILTWTVTGPAWTAVSYPTATTANQLLYSSANNVVGGLATGSNAVLVTDSSGVPSFQNMTGDVFAQYALLAGRAGGQTIYGGTAASETLTLNSTSHSTRGNIILNPNGGNVGIGSTLPSTLLNISANGNAVFATDSYGTNSYGPRLYGRKANGSQGSATAAGNTDILADFGGVGYSTTGFPNYASAAMRVVASETHNSTSKGTYLSFHTTATGTNTLAERVRLTPSGDVGIGTVSPSAKLEVAGTVKATAFEGAVTSTTTSSGAGSNSSPSISFSGDTDTGFYNAASDNKISVAAGGVKIFDFSSLGLVSPTAGGASISTAAGTAAAPTFSFAGDTDTGWFLAAADTMAASTAGQERMRISSTGNVGIGVSSPAYKLDVAGVGNFSQQLRAASNSSAVYTTTSSSLSSPNPTALLISNNNQSANGLFGGMAMGSYNSNGNIQRAYVGTVSTSGSASYTPTLVFGQQVTDSQSYAERMRIDPSGNVGIGTATPAATLNVESTINATSDSSRGFLSTTTMSPSAASTGNYWGGYFNVIYSSSNATTGGVRGLEVSANHTGATTMPYMWGLNNLVTNWGAGTISNGYGNYSILTNNAGGAITSGIGNFASVKNAGAGTISSAVGGLVSVVNSGTGTLTNGYGLKIEAPTNSGGGTFTNFHGLYIASPTAATKNYSIYSEGGANYFGGNVGVGTTTPSQNLTVAGNQTTSGYLRVGNNATPANTTAGDLTVSRLSIGNTAISGTRIVDITGTLNDTTGSPAGMQATSIVNPSADSAASFRSFVQSSTIYGSNNLTGEVYGSWIETRMNGTQTSVKEATGLTAFGTILAASANNFGTITDAQGISVAGVSAFSNSKTGTITNARGLRVLNSRISSPGQQTITSQAGVSIDALTGAANNTSLLIGTNAIPAGQFGIYNSSTHASYFAGNVGIGITNPGYKLDVQGGGVNASAGYTQTSDLRLKTNIEYLSSREALDKIFSLRGIYYDWKDPVRLGPGHQIGLIAQDVQKVFPEAVRTNAEGFLSVSYSNLVAPVVEAIKELLRMSDGHSREIASLKIREQTQEQKIQKLEQENAELKMRLGKIEKLLQGK